MERPAIVPPKELKYDLKQSRFREAPKLSTRLAFLGPTGVGKSVACSWMLLNMYKSLFSRIYLFSPNAPGKEGGGDETWRPVRDYIEKVLKVDETEEQFFFSDFSEEALADIVERQAKIAAFCKKRGGPFYQIAIVFDDNMSNVNLRNSKTFNDLWTRGRHSFISTFYLQQAFKLGLAPSARKNLSGLLVFRLRNSVDRDSLVQEFSALRDKDEILAAYNNAVGEDFGFLYINFMERDPALMFMSKFDTFI